MKTLIKLDRFFAWVLFLGMLLYFISGYGMTKGIIDSSFATSLHMDILTYVILVAFTVHTSYAIHLAFKRWQIWGGPTKILLVLFFAIFLGSFIYIDRYYKVADQMPVESSPGASSQNQNSNSSASTTNSNANLNTNTNTVETFTLTELAKYNGKNGQPAYVAVDGDIYDLTSVFTSGSHFSHYAGTELTNAFYSRHAKNVLSKYPIVGKMAE